MGAIAALFERDIFTSLPFVLLLPSIHFSLYHSLPLLFYHGLALIPPSQ